MEIQLNELITKIKEDGVEKAEARAKEIVEEANKTAEKIISDANKAAEKIIFDAKAQREKEVKSGEESLSQAGRNLMITFRESVNKELANILAQSTNAALKGDSLSALIVKAAEGLSADSENSDITVLLNSEDLKKIEAGALKALREKLLEGVTLKPDDDFEGGFRIKQSGSGAYFDYSAKEIADMLSCYLSPKITALLKEGNV